jgi:hypothetical protein
MSSLNENNIVPTRHILTFSNSRCGGENDFSRNTGGFLVFYEGAEVDHSISMPESIANISAKEEYNIYDRACMSKIQMHIYLNHIKEVEER